LCLCLLVLLLCAAGAAHPPSAATTSAAAVAAAAAAGDTGGGDDPLVSAALAAAEVKLLTKKLSAADKQVTALKEVFNKRVKAFRDAVRCEDVEGGEGVCRHTCLYVATHPYTHVRGWQALT
jgi:hypothetical protein